jgi:hypothetical protein
MRPDGKCRSCGAAIVWAVTAATARNIPLDPNPTPRGNIRLVPSANPTGPLIAQLLGKGELQTLPESEDRYVSHFSSCPNAMLHRKPRKAP